MRLTIGIEAGKLFRQILSTMKYVDGSNNYVQNTLVVEVNSEGLWVESGCVNCYGTWWPNGDGQFLPWSSCRISRQENFIIKPFRRLKTVL